MRKKLLQRVAAGVLSAALLLSVTACGGGSSNVATSDDGSIRKDLTAVELVKLMGNGINLGNTMEAYGRVSYGTTGTVTDYETFWGQPETTQEMISGMKAAGFDTLRIPVAWTNMMNYEDGDYTIDEAYLDRVEEIMNYALNEDMYVIINDHWDGGWWGMFGSADELTREAAMELYTTMWTQIANRYKRYSDRVIFESANEELGNRLNDTDIAEDSGSLSEDECYEELLRINQAFVDTVRGTGGNNAQRFLLIAGYNTDIDMTVDDRYQMPTDTADSKLLISVHYYEPDGYCINTSLDYWGSKTDYETMNENLAKMAKFTEQGYGVVIGEYGVLLQDGERELKENAYAYYENLLDNCDLYGYAPILWDTNGTYNKSFQTIIDKSVAELYQTRSYANEAVKSEDDIKSEAQARMEDAVANAQEPYRLPDDEAMAWIMYNSSDWSTLYSVGDVYSPDSKSGGVVATDVEITGEGTYTVALDFTGVDGGYANSTVFSALAIGNGETLFPGYIIDIQEIKINGEVYEPVAKGYTTTDDGLCTRVNLYNAWVTQIPDDIRTIDGDTSDVSASILDADTLGNVETIEITFDYVAP
jgi:endoglucanase